MVAKQRQAREKVAGSPNCPRAAKEKSSSSNAESRKAAKKMARYAERNEKTLFARRAQQARQAQATRYARATIRRTRSAYANMRTLNAARVMKRVTGRAVASEIRRNLHRGSREGVATAQEARSHVPCEKSAVPARRRETRAAGSMRKGDGSRRKRPRGSGARALR